MNSELKAKLDSYLIAAGISAGMKVPDTAEELRLKIIDYLSPFVLDVQHTSERVGGVAAMKLMLHHATLHGLGNQAYYAKHYLKSHEQVPDQPLDSATLKALGIDL